MSQGYCYLIKVFYDTGDALSAPDTSCYDAIFLVEALHIVDQLNGQLAAGAAERVAKRNSAAIDIDNFRIQLQPADHRQGLGRKGFIQLDKVDLAEVHSGLA